MSSSTGSRSSRQMVSLPPFVPLRVQDKAQFMQWVRPKPSGFFQRRLRAFAVSTGIFSPLGNDRIGKPAPPMFQGIIRKGLKAKVKIGGDDPRRERRRRLRL